MLVWWHVGPENPIGQWHEYAAAAAAVLPLLLFFTFTQVAPFAQGELAQAGNVDVSHLIPFHWTGHAQLDEAPAFF